MVYPGFTWRELPPPVAGATKGRRRMNEMTVLPIVRTNRLSHVRKRLSRTVRGVLTAVGLSLLYLVGVAGQAQNRAMVRAASPQESSVARIWIPGVSGVLEMDVGTTSWRRDVRSDG